MYLSSYFLELKNRSLLLVFTWSSTVLVCYIFKEVLLYFVTSTGNMIVPYFIFTDVVEVFSTYALLIFFIGNQLLLIYFFYHFLAFIFPSLTILECNFIIFGFFIFILLFLFSTILFNTFLFPVSWDFFLSFQKLEPLKSFSLFFEAKLIEYVTFYIKLYYLCFLYFQIFLFPILIFTRLNFELNLYKSFRKFLYYLCFVFATVVTPPDIFSQLLLSLFIIVSCEILVYGFALKISIKFFN